MKNHSAFAMGHLYGTRAGAAINVLFLVFSVHSLAAAVELHISPDGNDAAAGTREAPFASLARAQRAARQASAAGDKVTVFLAGGTCYLDEPLVLTAADSGTEAAPVIYAAEPGAEAVISGGLALKLEWRPFRDRIVRAKTPEGLAIDQVFVDGRSQRMARYPNYEPEVLVYNGYDAGAFGPERAARWNDPAGGFIHAMHRSRWGGYHYLITGKSADDTVLYEGGWQNNRQMGMHKEHRYVANIFEELDAPGEWFHDAASATLYYYPPQDVDLDEATIEVVRLRQLVEFRGSQSEPVAHVRLRGLTFRHAARTFMETKEPLLRSDWTIYRGGAVRFEGAEDCGVEDCTFDQLGGNAVFASNYNRRIALRGCLLSDCGASGVCFVGDPGSVRNPLFEYRQRQAFDQIDLTPGPKTDNYPADCLVEDCLIRRIGRVEKQVAGVQISMAARITVRHCSIYETPRAGINISEGTFGGHLVEFCDVFDTVLETGDHGSFNSWGRDRFWGLEDVPEGRLPELALLDAIEPTVLRNSRWRCDHGWDIDLDDGSSNYRVVNNLLLNGGLKFREGFHRVAENNVMVGNSFHPHVWYPDSGDIVRRNIAFTPYRPIRVPTPWGREIDFNLLHQPEISEPRPATELQQQSGRDEHSLVADARFADPAAGDYRVAEDSPARMLGFENFSMDRFGVRKENLKAIARTPELPQGESPENKASETSSVTHCWLGAIVRDLVGEEYSAFGASKDAGGVHVVEVPAGSWADRCGLKSNDLVQSLDGKPVANVKNLLAVQNEVAGRSLSLEVTRSQEAIKLRIESYPFATTETADKSNVAKFLVAPDDGRMKIESIVAKPPTVNEPVAVLVDGRVEANYGPVFRNGVVAGTYKIDLGRQVDIRVVKTCSFNQNGNRGAQHFVLYGSLSKTDPGWDVSDLERFVPIAEVDTQGMAPGQYQATSVEVFGGTSLGTYRWLVWVAYPVTGKLENTAFQEFQVIGRPAQSPP